jgi:hypothetical protein
MKYYRSAEEVEVVDVVRAETEQGSEEDETKKKKSKGRKSDDGGTDTVGKGLKKKGGKAAREQKRTVK